MSLWSLQTPGGTKEKTCVLLPSHSGDNIFRFASPEKIGGASRGRIVGVLGNCIAEPGRSELGGGRAGGSVGTETVAFQGRREGEEVGGADELEAAQGEKF